MDKKDQLIKTIQDWVRLDNEIRKLKKEENIRKTEQKKISCSLMEIMRDNEIDEFDINKASDLNNFIVENREEVVVETIVRKIKDN